MQRPHPPRGRRRHLLSMLREALLQLDLAPNVRKVSKTGPATASERNGTADAVPFGDVFNWRKRRDSVSHGRYGAGYIIIAQAQERQDQPARYQAPRPRKLTAEDETAIRAASGRSLRELASTYGVSHETIRTIRRSTVNVAAD